MTDIVNLHQQNVDWRPEVERLNIPDHPFSVTLFISADVFMKIFKFLSLTATMSGAVLLFGRFQNSGRAVGAAGKIEAQVIPLCRKWIHWDETETIHIPSIG
jgi:hypothetical protein